MGVNSNFDNSFLMPSLPPPQEGTGQAGATGTGQNPLENLKEKKGVQQQKDGQGNVREKDKEGKSDGSQIYSDNQEGEVHTESEIHDHEQQEQGQDGQGGGQGSGEHDSSGGGGGSSGGQSDHRDDEGVFSFQEQLEALVGKVGQGRNVAHISSDGQTQVLSRDEILQIDSNVQFKDKYNLAEAFSAKDLASLNPDFPDIPAIRNFVLDAVTKEITANPWLNTAFMTTLAENLLAVVRIKMEQQLIEGKVTVQLLNVIADLGLALGDLAMKKANLEAEMHRFQALAAFLSFGVTLAAGALSIAGTIGSAAAGGVKSMSASKNAATSGAAAGGSPTGGPTGTGSGTSSFASKTSSTSPSTSTTSTASSFTGGSRGAGSTTASGGTTASGSTSATGSTTASGSAKASGITEGQMKTPIGAQRGRNAETRVNIGSKNQRNPEPATPWQSAAPKTSVNQSPSTSQTGSANQTSGVAGAPQKASTTSTGETIKDGNVSSRVSAEAKSTTSAESRAGWKSGLKTKYGKAGDGGGLEATGTPGDKAALKAHYIEKGGDIAGHLGQTLLQGSSQLANAADNLVQMAFKPLIGAVERETQIMQAQKQIAQQALESASNDFKEAGQSIDAALQALQKVQDETTRAHTLSRG